MAIDDVELGRTVQLLLESRKPEPDAGNEVLPMIYMVPSVYREQSPSSFKPKVVSVGPLHKEDEKLVKFEGEKLTYLHHLLDRVDSPSDQTLEACLKKVSGSVDRIRACYLGMKNYKDVDLVKMMVIDACFILDFLFSLSDYDSSLRKNMLITQPMIYDLLLIENQIPFFVLQDIFNCTILKFSPTTSLLKFIEVLLRNYNIFDTEIVIDNVSADTPPDHILGLLHKSYNQPAHITFSNFKSIPKAYSVVQLDRAGVKIRLYEDGDWPLAMKTELHKFSCFPLFRGSPTLSIPRVNINGFTKLILSNLIVYEQCSLVRNYFTSYASAMGKLISTPDDVAMLVDSGVLVNELDSNREAANMIKSLIKDIHMVHFFYAKEWRELEYYCSGYWTKKSVELREQFDAYHNGLGPNTSVKWRRKFFSNPWNGIAVFAGIVLFVLTVVQTIYTIKAANPVIVIKN